MIADSTLVRTIKGWKPPSWIIRQKDFPLIVCRDAEHRSLTFQKVNDLVMLTAKRRIVLHHDRGDTVVHPRALVLTSGYRWKRAEVLEPGEMLVHFQPRMERRAGVIHDRLLKREMVELNVIDIVHEDSTFYGLRVVGHNNFVGGGLFVKGF